MIDLNNIKKIGKSRYTMDCHVYDPNIRIHDFSLEFDPATIEIFSAPTGDPMVNNVYAKCAVRHLFYMLENHEPIPEKSVAA